MVVAWITFLGLPPNVFSDEAIFVLAVAVGKPLQMDQATKNQTRSRSARVKVEVDLLKEFPKRIKISVKMGERRSWRSGSELSMTASPNTAKLA